MNRRQNIINILLFLGILLVCIVHAGTSIHNADFGPLNGTFQDFNPIRHFTAGQIPYRDFSDYLGLGHLYLGTITTGAFGGSFTASKTAFTFLALFSLSMISAALGTAIFGSLRKGLSVTGIMLTLMLIQPVFFKNFTFTEEIWAAFSYPMKNGNSARMVRGFIVPLTLLILMTAIRLITRGGKHRNKWLFLIFSFFSGFVLPWSNDYGISLFVCLFLFFGIVVFSRTRSLLKTLAYCAADAVISLAGALVCVEIFTLGNAGGWVKTTFGIGDFQRWYPNTEKHFYIFSVDMSWCSMLQIILVLLYIRQIFISRGAGRALIRYGIPGLANMTGFCAMNEYYMISGDSAREIPLIILTLTTVFELISFLQEMIPERKDRFENGLLLLSVICMLSWTVPTVYDEFIYQKLTKKPGIFIPQMGGNVTELGESLAETSKKLDGAKIFSTYASAMELVTDQFQPSGTDYIIHVLGNENRDAYLDVFKTDDFQYAVTIREDFSPWEHYIQRSNWYFYRELCRSWHPAFSNRYQLYWERNTEGESHIVNGSEHPIEVTVEQNEPTKARIIIRTDPGVNGFADLLIDYQVNKNNSMLAKLLFQRMLYVSEDKNSFSELPFYGTNYLRESSHEYIPVTIINGYGEIVLTSRPEENTNLAVNLAECEEIYTAPLDYVKIIDLGYSGEDPCFRIPKTLQNRAAVSSRTHIITGPYDIPITGISEDDDGILVMLDLNDISFPDLENHIGSQTVALVR